MAYGGEEQLFDRFVGDFLYCVCYPQTVGTELPAVTCCSRGASRDLLFP
jgi:hypothetical protein